MNLIKAVRLLIKPNFMKNDLKQADSLFSRKIISWYEIGGRSDLPWRKNITAYRVWISEIMLQQTQVKTVIPFYKKFIKRYPSLKSLSEATEEDILALWTGLGFYRRAKNIFKTKEILKNDFKNRFPKSFKDIVSLPGIGNSTAGAIMSIAYRNPQPILDANVKRTLSRFESIQNDSSSSADKILWQFSSKHTPQNKIFEYTQGIMDLGATVCTPSSPSCDICPLSKLCKSAFRVSKEKSTRKKINPTRKINFVLAINKKSLLLFKKQEETFWESLWTPYELETGNKLPWNDSYKNKEEINLIHKLSHLNLDINITILYFDKKFHFKSNKEHKWIEITDIDKFGLPKPIKSIITNL